MKRKYAAATSLLWLSIAIAVSLATISRNAVAQQQSSLRGDLYRCLKSKIPGVELDIGNPNRAFDHDSQRNFAWDEQKQAWIDTKTLECICGPCHTSGGGSLRGDYWRCLKSKIPGVELDIGNPNRAFDHDSQRNFAWDEQKQAWIDTKTLECICPARCVTTATRPTETPVTPPPAEECDPVITKISDLVDQLATASETVGSVTIRKANTELAKDISAEEKKAALEADNFALTKNKNLALKLKDEVRAEWDKFTRNRPCAKSRPELEKLLNELDELSGKIGADQVRGYENPEKLKADRNEVESVKSQIKDLFASCCAKKQGSQNTKETFNRTEVYVGYQYQRAPAELVKNLNGINGQVFYDFKKHIGLGADFAWATGSDRIGTTNDIALDRFTATFGPEFTWVRIEGPVQSMSPSHGIPWDMKLSIRPTAGFVRDRTVLSSASTSSSSSSTAFMMSFGVSLDLLKKNFGIRLFDFAYQPTHFGGTWQSNWKLGAGIVFRFGKEK